MICESPYTTKALPITTDRERPGTVTVPGRSLKNTAMPILLKATTGFQRAAALWPPEAKSPDIPAAGGFHA
jgi:hypothetical protein